MFTESVPEKWNADHLEKGRCFARKFFIVFFFHQALIRLLSSFSVISPPPDKYQRRPPSNTQGGRPTYGTFYWLCCFLLLRTICPFYPLLHIARYRQQIQLASQCVDESVWLKSSLLNPDCAFQGPFLGLFFLFWVMRDKSPLMTN